MPQLATFRRRASRSRTPRASSRRRIVTTRSVRDHEALRCKETGEAKTILFNLTGHGHFDGFLRTGDFAGELEDFAIPEEAIKESLLHLPRSAD